MWSSSLGVRGRPRMIGVRPRGTDARRCASWPWFTTSRIYSPRPGPPRRPTVVAVTWRHIRSAERGAPAEAGAPRVLSSGAAASERLQEDGVRGTDARHVIPAGPGGQARVLVERAGAVHDPIDLVEAVHEVRTDVRARDRTDVPERTEVRLRQLVDGDVQ